MAPTISDEDARDLELQHEMEEAYEVFLHAAGEERSTAKNHNLKLLSAFAARVLRREPRIAEMWEPSQF